MFDFLEVDKDEHKQNVHLNNPKVDIPDNQRLSLSDLETIKPELNTLNLISKKILDKYLIVPLFILIPGGKPFLPKTLKPDFWGHAHGEKNITIYVGMFEPFNEQVLNIIKNITTYSVVSIPLKKDCAATFLKINYHKTLNPNSSTTKSKKDNFVYKFLKENYLYIFLFSFVIIGLISLKMYI